MKFLIHDSPVGPLSLVSDGQALATLAFEAQTKAVGLLEEAEPGSDAILDTARRQLDAYFKGQTKRFDLPLAPRGTPFQQRVWKALREIPYGRTCTYGDIAAAVGAPKAVRAVGGANGRNPIAIIVPCHRVIGADGTLTGFGGGMDRKRFLLTHEQGQAVLTAVSGAARARARRAVPLKQLVASPTFGPAPLVTSAASARTCSSARPSRTPAPRAA